MDADINNTPDLADALLPPDLTRQQIDVFELLRDLSTEREQFHEWYLGAIQVLASKSPDKLAQAANSIRELCEKLATRMNVAESQSPLPPLRSLLNVFPEVKASAYANGWEGEAINKRLNNFLVELEEKAKLFDEPSRTARLKLALTNSDPQAEFMSKAYREARDEAFRQVGVFFQKVTHHGHAPDEVEFGKELNLFESLLLNYLTPCTAAQQNELMSLITGMPSREALARVDELISHKGANYILFFEKLDNANWLPLLEERGHFTDLPEPEPIGDGRKVYKIHVPLIALAKLATSSPREVTAILVRLKLPENPRVGDQIVHCMANIRDPACVKQLLPVIEQLGKNSSRTSWFRIEELLKSWMELKMYSEVFLVIRGCLNRAIDLSFSQHRDEFNIWQTKQIDEKFLTLLAAEFPFEIAFLVFKALSKWASLERQKYSPSEITEDAPYSYIQEDFKSAPASHRGIADTLAIRLYSAAEQIYRLGDTSRIDELDKLLRSNPWQLFRRVRWQLYADFPAKTFEQARAEVLQRIPFLNEINYSRGAHDYEFAQLLVAHVKKHGDAFLSADEVELFAGTVWKGPIDKDGNLLEGNNDFFYRKQLWPIAPILRGAQLAAYRNLVPDDGKIRIENFKPQSFGGVSGGFVASEAPPEADAMESMSDEQLWNFLNTWQPKVNYPTSERWVQQDVSALGARFAVMVDKQPARFIPASRWWENISRSEILNKIIDRATDRVVKKQGDDKTPAVTPTESDWANWLGITKWIMSQKWSRDAVARFLGKVSGSDQSIPDYYFLELPELLRSLVEEIDSRLVDDKNSFNDWLTTAINSIRGEAIEALLNLALRQKNAGKEIEPWIFELIRSRLELPEESPAVFALLGAKLRFLIHLFKQELQESPNLLFPPDKLEHRSAAITAHFKYDQPWDAIIEVFPEFIEIALGTLQAMRAEVEDDETKQNRRDFGSQLGTHIACYYWNGSFSSDVKGEAALDSFFAVASKTTRATLISQIAWIWEKHGDEPRDEKVVRKVMRIWERRYAQIQKKLKLGTTSSSEYDGELAGSIDWLSCECLPFEWRFTQAKSSLERLKKAPQAYRLLKAITEFSVLPGRLEPMLELFRTLLKRPSDELRWSIQFKELAPIISLGLASDKPTTKKLAKECKDLLLKMGFSDFLNL